MKKLPPHPIFLDWWYPHDLVDRLVALLNPMDQEQKIAPRWTRPEIVGVRGALIPREYAVYLERDLLPAD